MSTPNNQIAERNAGYAQCMEEQKQATRRVDESNASPDEKSLEYDRIAVTYHRDMLAIAIQYDDSAGINLCTEQLQKFSLRLMIYIAINTAYEKSREAAQNEHEHIQARYKYHCNMFYTASKLEDEGVAHNHLQRLNQAREELRQYDNTQ